ncbi:hypothetical protein ABB02_00253 [Clostridiaceae bacterium JG1575]|nr:hypothetical protein ABB02_00253 [Clostridiaceae bacterium JG1575]
MSTAALRSREMEREAEFFFLSSEEENVIDAAKKAYASPVPEVRMYAVFLLGHCSLNPAVRTFMRKEVSKDPHWRVQEVLAKAFDRFCAINGMEKSLPVIDEWLQDENPNTRRAVTEELRIWTSRDYFKEHPEQAVKRIASLRNDSGESVRKSAGNALRDISKKLLP